MFSATTTRILFLVVILIYNVDINPIPYVLWPTAAKGGGCDVKQSETKGGYWGFEVIRYAIQPTKCLVV